MKKISLILLTIALTIVLCSCGSTPATKSEILRYARNEYGTATVIDTEEISEDEIKYYLKDSEYGFEYYITSKVTDINIDGSTLGKTESKNSDFILAYYNHITEMLNDELDELEDSYGVEIDADATECYGVGFNVTINYKTDDLQTAPKLSEKVYDLYKECDTRECWLTSEIDVYDKYGERIGCYYSKYGKWLSKEKEDALFYRDKAKKLNPDAVYVRKEEKLFKDTGLTLDNLLLDFDEEPPTDDSVVTFYYFEVDGKEFFIADVMLNTGGYWYNNYYEIIEEY